LARVDTTLEVKHGLVFVEAEQLLFSNAVQHILQSGNEPCV
jgi:hypothetical protein